MSFHIPIPLRWSDVDEQGHVNHAVLMTLFEECRSRLLVDSGSTLAGNIVAARIEVDFIAPLLYTTTSLDVSATVAHIGGRSIRLEQVIRSGDPNNPLEHARAVVVLVAFEPATQRSREITPEERDWLSNLA